MLKSDHDMSVPPIALLLFSFLASATVAYGMNATLAEARRGRARPVEEVEAVEVEDHESPGAPDPTRPKSSSSVTPTPEVRPNTTWSFRGDGPMPLPST